MLNGYHSDDEIALLDDNKLHQGDTQQNKKRHLQTQESISDTEFFSQRFDGPGLKNLSKQENIIEEEEPSFTATEVKPVRVATTREV